MYSVFYNFLLFIKNFKYVPEYFSLSVFYVQQFTKKGNHVSFISFFSLFCLRFFLYSLFFSRETFFTGNCHMKCRKNHKKPQHILKTQQRFVESNMFDEAGGILYVYEILI